MPPDEIVVDVRDNPEYWIFVRPHDFLATDLETVFVEPEPLILRDTVVVNETVVVHDRGFAVNPGIEPAYLAAEIGRPVPEFQVRPRVLAGTVPIQDAIQVRAEDLRHENFRHNLVQESNIRETNNLVRPAASVPRPQPLGANEHGRLGQNPPRAASGVAQHAPQPSPNGMAPGQQRERGAMGPAPEQQREMRERGAPGPTPNQQRGLREATGPTPEQQRGRDVYDRAAPGPAQERGQRERGATGPTPEQPHVECASAGRQVPRLSNSVEWSVDQRARRPNSSVAMAGMIVQRLAQPRSADSANGVQPGRCLSNSAECGSVVRLG